MCLPLAAAALPALGASASTTALVSGGLNLASTVGGFIGSSKKTNATNRAILQKHNLDVEAYNNKYRREVIAYRDDIQNADIKINDLFKDSMMKLAMQDLDIWKALGQKSQKEQEAYAQLMTIGTDERQGRRSGTKKTIAKRLMGRRMSDLAFQMTANLDKAEIKRDYLDSQVRRTVDKRNIAALTGKPVAGPPPKFPGFQKEPKFPWLKAATDVVGAAGLFNKLKAPDAIDLPSNSTFNQANTWRRPPDFDGGWNFGGDFGWDSGFNQGDFGSNMTFGDYTGVGNFGVPNTFSV